MLKYVNTGVVFQEIPDEVTLAVNIANCPCHCPGCHSKYLWENIGKPLTPMVIDQMLKQYRVAWYSGRQRIPSSVKKSDFDYIKVGPYIAHLGCLKERTTNQRLYKKASGDDFTDITSRFWK